MGGGTVKAVEQLPFRCRGASSSGESAGVPADQGEPITPELVLVDPVLRERLLRESLQELLHEGTEVLRRRAREVLEPSTHNAFPAPVSLPGTRSARRTLANRSAYRLLRSAITLAALAALFVAIPSLAFLPPRQAPRLEVPEQRASTLARPRLTWQTDPGADYYRLEVVSAGRLVQVAYPSSPPVLLGRLAPGDYTWRVFAGRGAIADHDTRGPIAGGIINVAESDQPRG